MLKILSICLMPLALGGCDFGVGAHGGGGDSRWRHGELTTVPLVYANYHRCNKSGSFCRWDRQHPRPHHHS